MTTAVFLDRDNTLIHNDGDLGDPEEVRLIKGAASAIASLRGLGYKIVVVSNQGGVARGKFKESDVEAVHRRIEERVKATSGSMIDRFYFCPYHPKGKIKKYRSEHPWRKPNPGMLLQAAKDLQLDLAHSWMIGDQLRDVQAAAGAGVRAILLSGQKAGLSGQPPVGEAGEKDGGTPSCGEGDPPQYWVAVNLIEAVRVIAKQGRAEPAGEPVGAGVPDRKSQTKKPVAMKPSREETQDGGSPSVPIVTHAVAPQHSRPFRPWATQPVDQDPTDTLNTSGISADPPPPSEETVAEEPCVTDESEAKAKRPPVEQVQAEASDPPTDHHLLRQILQELRNQRAVEMDFSYQNMMAIVLQMIAVVCLLGALWMGVANLELFVRWICVGLVMQLATIAMLLFRR